MVELTPGSLSNALLTLMLGIAVCWLTLKVPSLLRSRHSQAGLFNVVTLVAASRAVGAIGGAAAGGGAGQRRVGRQRAEQQRAERLGKLRRPGGHRNHVGSARSRCRDIFGDLGRDAMKVIGPLGVSAVRSGVAPRSGFRCNCRARCRRLRQPLLWPRSRPTSSRSCDR